MIRVGPAGWNYRDWNGIVYPEPKPRGFDELTYLSEYFDVVEINSSYYGPPRPTSAKKWVERVSTNPRFRFTAKLFHSFTHERHPALNDEKEFKKGNRTDRGSWPPGGVAASVSVVLPVFTRKPGLSDATAETILRIPACGGGAPCKLVGEGHSGCAERTHARKSRARKHEKYRSGAK